jgi:murein DD-endopeptidase MepM/ murein hydrolase activator NlpD
MMSQWVNIFSVMELPALLLKYRESFQPVVPFDPASDKLFSFDFTENNKELSAEQVANTENFAGYISGTLHAHGSRYGIGGYGEHRTLYARSRHFDGVEEPRRLHLGVDIWGPAGTKVMAPVNGIVHSYAFNNHDSDYGATIILTHNIEGNSFHTLYGHLSLNSIKNLHEGKRIIPGEVFTEFGMRFENGNWPAHLHFQIISDMQEWKGDYPGVCKYSEKDEWLQKCPDADLILNMNQYLG